MTARRKSSLKHMLAALTEADRRRVEQAVVGLHHRVKTERMRHMAWRILTAPGREAIESEREFDATGCDAPS